MMLGWIEGSPAPDVPIGRSLTEDIVIHTDNGRRVVIGTGTDAALIVTERGIGVNTEVSPVRAMNLQGDTKMDGDVWITGETIQNQDVHMNMNLTVDLAAKFTDSNMVPTSRSLSTHQKYGMRVGNARVVGPGDVLGTVIVADRLYERSETSPPFQVKVNFIDYTERTITLTKLVDLTWAAPEKSTFMLEPSTPDGTYIIIAIGDVAGQTCKNFVIKSQHDLTVQSVTTYTYTQLVTTSALMDEVNTFIQLNPNDPLTVLAPGYVMNPVENTISFGGLALFEHSETVTRYFYDVDSDQAFKLIGTNTLESVAGNVHNLNMRSALISYLSERIDHETSGHITLRLTPSDDLTTTLLTESTANPGQPIFTDYGGKVVRIDVGTKSFELLDGAVLVKQGALYTEVTVVLADSTEADAPELAFGQNNIYLATNLQGESGRGLTDRTVDFNCELQIDVMEEFVDANLVFLSGPPDPLVEKAFFSAAITYLIIDGTSYSVVGKEVVERNVEYKVRLLASEFDTSSLDLGDVDITIRFKDVDFNYALNFLFTYYVIDQITPPESMRLENVPTAINFNDNSARMDFTGLLPKEVFNSVPHNTYIQIFQIRESNLHLQYTAYNVLSQPNSSSVVIDVQYEYDEHNILDNGLNSMNAKLSGVPAKVSIFTMNGNVACCVIESVIPGTDPVPEGSSHMYIYLTQPQGFVLVRIKSRYRNNSGKTKYELVPISAEPDWYGALVPGDFTILYTIPFKINDTFNVGEGGPYGLLDIPVVTHPFWLRESEVSIPTRTPNLVILAEAPLMSPSLGAPATLLTTGTIPQYQQETLLSIPQDKDLRFPRAVKYVHEAEPEDRHTYTFYVGTYSSATGTVLDSYRFAPVWSAPGGKILLRYPDDSIPLTLERNVPTTDGVMDTMAGTLTVPLDVGGVFYLTPTLKFSKMTPILRTDTWATSVKVNANHTVVMPYGSTRIQIGGFVYDSHGLSTVTVSSTLPAGPMIAFGMGDLYDLIDATLVLPASLDTSVTPPFQLVTVPAANLPGGAGTTYSSLTVTGSDGIVRHLDIPSSGIVKFRLVTSPPAISTLSAQMHIDSAVRATGLGVRLPPSGLSASITGYFKYIGDASYRTLLTAGVALATSVPEAILTLFEHGTWRMATCVATVATPGTVSLSAGSYAQMKEGVEAVMMEGLYLPGAVLSTTDVLTYTTTSETTAMLAGGAVPGTVLITLIGKPRIKVEVSRLSSVASLTFDAVGSTVPCSMTALAPLSANMAILNLNSPASTLELYDEVDALPWSAVTATSMSLPTGYKSTSGKATVLLKLNYRGRSWLETTVDIAGGTATLATDAPTPKTGCIAVIAANGSLFAVAISGRTFACSTANATGVPALLIHPRDFLDVLTHDIPGRYMSVSVSPVTRSRLLSEGAILFVEEYQNETDILRVNSAADISETDITGYGSCLKRIYLNFALDSVGVKNLAGTRVAPLIAVCPSTQKSVLSKIIDLQQLDKLIVGHGIENDATLTVNGDLELSGPLYSRNESGDAITLDVDVHGLASIRRRDQNAEETIGLTTVGDLILRRGVQPRTVDILSDQRFGTLTTLDATFVDSALQYLRRASFARDSNASEIRLLPQASRVDGHTGTYSVDALVRGTVFCGKATSATCINTSVTFNWKLFELIPVVNDWVVISLSDGIRHRLRVRSVSVLGANCTLSVNYDFGTASLSGIVELTELESSTQYDNIQLAATTAAAVHELSRAIRVVDVTKTRFHDLEYQGNGVRPVGAGTNEMTVYISDPTTVAAAQTSALSTVLDADKRLQIGRNLVKDWTNFEVGTDLDQKTTVLHGALTVGTTRSSGSNAGYHANTVMYGSLTLGEDTVTGQEPTRLYGSFTVGATEQIGITAGHHAPIRLYGSLTLGENTTTGQEPTLLYGTFTVGATEQSGITAGHHAATRMYGSLTLGENTTTGQEPTQLYGALTVGATEQSGITAGHHAATRLYGSLTLGDNTTTGQEATLLYGTFTVGAGEVAGVTAGHHAATRMYGSLTLGEDSFTGQEPTRLYGALTVGATEVGGVISGHHAATRMFGSLTLGENTTTGQEATLLYGTFTVGATEVSGVTAGHHAATRLYGSLTLGEDTTTGQEATRLYGALTVGATEQSGVTVGHHAATRLFGSLTLGEATTTGQEPTVLNGAVTIGASQPTGSNAGKHANTIMYGSLTVGEDTLTAQEATRLYGALTVGAGEQSGVTAGHHATIRLYGPLTLGENTTTGQEETLLYGAFTVGATEQSGVTAGHHAATRLYGSLTLGEATTTGQEPTVLNGAVTIGATQPTGSNAGKHANTIMYGSLTVGEDTLTAQEATRLYGALTVGATEQAGVTAGHHAATRLFGSLTLGESTTTGQEPTILNGALTVGEAVNTGAIAGKHANTKLYGQLQVGEATSTAQETTVLNGAVTIGAGEVGGVTSGKHAATRIYGSLTLGENTTTGQEATRLYGALTVGATEVSSVTAGHHAATVMYGSLTVGEATTTGQEATLLNGPFTVGVSVGAGAIAGKHANTTLYGKLTVGEATSSAQETTVLNGAVTIGASVGSGATAGKHANTVINGSLTVGESSSTAQEPTLLNGSLTVGDSTNKGNTNLHGTLTVSDNQLTSLTGTLTVTGLTTVNNTTVVNTGNSTLMDVQASGSSKFRVDNGGNLQAPCLVGMISYFGHPSGGPVGWLKCDGGSYSTSTYASLFGVVGYQYGGGGGSFNVPDLRGLFIRTIDGGTGRDTDGTRTAGNVQSDMFMSHNHSTNGAGAHNHNDPSNGTGTTATTGSHTHTVSSENAHTPTMLTAGAHSHGATISNTLAIVADGAHNHTVTAGAGTLATASNGGQTATTDFEFAHTHTGTADTAGEHYHTYLSNLPPGQRYDGDKSTPNEAVKTFSSTATDTAGAHSHNITINGAGGHDHTVTIANHTHFMTGAPSVSLATSATHTHTINGAITVSNPTAGDHVHTINEVPAHNHTLGAIGDHFHVITGVADHTHTVNNTGGTETRPKNMALAAFIKY